MSRAPPTSETQPLAVELARERLRKQAVADLLARMNTDPEAISHALGGELWLILTRSAFDRIADGQTEGSSTDELIDEVCRDLGRACHLALERDRQGDGPVLKINSESWYLLVKPGRPAWLVVAIRPQTVEFRASFTGLAWRLIRPNDETTGAVPLPLWLLALAQPRGLDLRLDRCELRNADQPVNERAEVDRLRQMREELPAAVQDLDAAFRLLQWERQRRDRQSWAVSLVPLGDGAATNGRCSYVVEQGKDDAWPQRSLRFALGLEPRASWVVVAPDPDSPSRWLLHGPAGLPSEVTISELPDSQYGRQAMIAARLTKPWMIRSEDTALAATQMPLRTIAATAPDFQPLPGEASWEPRQEEALRLALAGHPVCAIKGPPGTGKSTVIVGLIRRAIHSGQRVLLVAPTHVALDEVLGRIHELRQRNLERIIVPARVAPADERRVQVKPELEEYIAGNLGLNLARKALKHIRAKLAALPPDELHLDIMRRCGTTVDQLRNLAACRIFDEQAQHQLSAARVSRENTTKETGQRRAELLVAHSDVMITRQYGVDLAEATQRFTEVENRFVETRRTVSENTEHHRERQSALDEVRRYVDAADRRHEEAADKLRSARALAAKRRPTGKLGRLVERVFALHARAVKAVGSAEAEFAEAGRNRDLARRDVPPAEETLRAAHDALKQAKLAATEIERALRDRLAPAEAAIAAALGDVHANWFSSLPSSLHRAVVATSESVRSAADVETHANTRLAQAEAAEQAAALALSVAERAAEAERAKRVALEIQLREQEIPIEADLRHQIAAIEDEGTAAARELESTTRRRQVLQRWLEFYEHEDGDEQVTAWALQGVNLVAATTQGIAGSREFSEHDFDLVICDESSRVTRGEILVPADRAVRIVLVGDEKQLPPYVEADDEQLVQALATIQLAQSRAEALPEMAQRLCDAWNVDEPEFRPVRVEEVCSRAQALLAEGVLPEWPPSVTAIASIDERLRAWRAVADALTGSCFDHVLGLLPGARVVRLSVQRRMVAEIANLVSDPVYDGDYQSPSASPVAPLLTDAFRHAWVFFNTRSYCAARPEFRENHQGTGFINEGEARAVVLALKQHVVAARRSGRTVSLMVITFYLAQARLIESLARRDEGLRRERIAILPIDRCQGQEADAVVVSFVRTLPKPRPNVGRWLQDVRRLNVAFTRARHSLVLIGNLQTLTALRGDADGERLLAHLGHCVADHPEHHIEQLQGL